MLPRAALYDSNRYLLAGLLARFGAEVTDLGILSDDPKELARAIAAAAADHDLVLTSGGVSTGEADYVRSAIESIGRIVFWRVAIKPGRPVAMGVIPAPNSGDGAAFVGLPGNPVAVFVTFVRVVRPLLLRLAGALPEPLVAMPARVDLLLQEAQRPARICARGAARGGRRHHRGGQIRAGRRRRSHLAHRNRWPCRAWRRRDRIEPGATVGFLSYASLVG